MLIETTFNEDLFPAAKGGRMVKRCIGISNLNLFFGRKLMACMGTMVFAFALCAGQALAVEIKTDNPDLQIRFDNTLTYSLMDRLSDQDPNIIVNPQTDDGDRNFNKGIVMNRMDLLSLFDVSYKKFGVAFSGAAWYDTVYNTTNDNNSAATFNPISVPHNEFTDATVKWHGKGAELMEAMTFGYIPMGDMTFRYRVGQFSQWWGDSFFLGWNGVAGALAPVNVAKAATLPNVQLKELILPIPQVAGSLQVSDKFSLAAYYQFKWKPARLFATGSYFSPADLIGPGAERIFGPMFLKTHDITPKDSGQFGISAKLETQFAAYGLYYNKFHSKDFMIVPQPISGQYSFFYPSDIQQYAVSANKAVGEFTYAAEVAYRTNAPLQTDPHDFRNLGLNLVTVFPNFGPFVNLPHSPLYAKGDTLNITLNTFSGGMRGNFFCDAQDLIAEVAYVKQMSVNNENYVDPRYEKTGLTATVHYEPHWYEVASGLDLGLPLVVNYGFKGKPTSLIWGGSPQHGGDVTIGLYGLLDQVWEFELDYRNFFGKTYQGEPNPLNHAQDFPIVGTQGLADRDYVSLFIRRAF
jgi:hypothetical protein